jgi:ankyrin repeat protein
MRATYRWSSATAQLTLEPLKQLLAQEVDVNATDESGWTALMYASQLNSYDNQAVELLLAAHADVNRASLRGDTALMMDAYNGNWNEQLVKHGANIQASNADGVTALMLLAQQQKPDELRRAIAAGADANAKDNAGRSALDYLMAASCKRPIVPLPRPWMEITVEGPPPCPGTNEGYTESLRILHDAMKKRK